MAMRVEHNPLDAAFAALLVNGLDGAGEALRTLCYKLFAKAGYTGKEGRTAILKLALPMRHREWFEGIWNRSKTFDLPISFSPAFSP